MTSNVSRRGLLGSVAAAAGGLIVGPGLLSACTTTQAGTGASTQDTLAKIKKQGYVDIGFSGEQPYCFEQNGQLVGEAPTLHKAIFAAMGIKTLKPHLTDFDSLIPGLTAGRFDVISAGMAITPKRCKSVLFSEPEFVAATALMVKKGNPKGLTDLASCAAKGAKVGVLSAAVEADFAKAANVPAGNISTVAKQQDGLDSLVAGRIDAFALTSTSLRWLAKINASQPVEVLAPFEPLLEGKKQNSAGGAVFRPKDSSLQKAFNAELKKITSDQSKYTSLIGQYGFTDTIPPADVTTESLCKG